MGSVWGGLHGTKLCIDLFTFVCIQLFTQVVSVIHHRLQEKKREEGEIDDDNKKGVIKRSPTNYTFELRRTTYPIYIYITHTHITMKVIIDLISNHISNLSILAKKKKEGC